MADHQSKSLVHKLLNGAFSANQLGLFWLIGVLFLGSAGRLTSGYNSLLLIMSISIIQLAWHYFFLISVRRADPSPTSMIWTIIIAAVTTIATIFFLMAALTAFQSTSAA